MQPVRTIEQLERRLIANPGDLQSIRALVSTLEFVPDAPGIPGKHAAAQAALAKLPVPGEADLLAPEPLNRVYSKWLTTLDGLGVRRSVPIGQVFSGRILKIGDSVAHCGAWLKFFKETGVIPALCNDCYKVQILPHDLQALFQAHFLLLKLDLPNDNARKSMIELRDGIRYPYKSYIYCNGPAEARQCLQAFRALQAAHGITGISSAISHGCSEYGQRYPAFRYSEAADAPVFRPKPEWRATERHHFRNMRLPQPARASNTRAYLSLRDVLAFHTWVRYAALIGDPASGAFAPGKGPDLPPAFVRRVRAQAKTRATELQDLQTRVD